MAKLPPVHRINQAAPTATGTAKAITTPGNGCSTTGSWRNLLGGTQYGNTFPVFLGQALGKGSIAWIWRYCPNRVLDGMADSLGEA